MAQKFAESDKAHHEAGHAVIARALGVGVTHVALFSTGDDNSASAMSVSAAWKAREDEVAARIAAHEKDAKVSLAGPYAQHRYRPVEKRRGDSTWKSVWSGDLAQASSSVGWMVMLEEGTPPEDHAPGRIVGTLDQRQMAKAQQVLERIGSETNAMVAEHWPAIERVARALMESPLLSEAELDALIAVQQGLRPPLAF